jgi:hypothetical protein
MLYVLRVLVRGSLRGELERIRRQLDGLVVETSARAVSRKWPVDPDAEL